MSISYESVVEAVGPADLIVKLKAKILELEPGSRSSGVEHCEDLPNYVRFYESASELPYDVRHNRPTSHNLAHQEPSPIRGLFIRAEIITECVHYREWVTGDNKLLFAMSSELDQETPPTEDDPYPVIVHSTEGDPLAWTRALAAYGVEPKQAG